MKSKHLSWVKLEKTRTIWKRLMEKVWLWALLFAICVIYVSMPSRGPGWGSLKEGMVVTDDIVLPESVQIEDEAATEEKRNEVRNSVKVLFDYNPLAGTSLIDRVSTYFSLNRQALKDHASPINTYDELTISKEFLQTMKAKGFNTEMENLLTSIIARLYRRPIIANKNFLTSLHASGFVQRSITTGRETLSYDVFSPRSYPDEVEDFIQSELQGTRHLTRKERSSIIKFLMANIQPSLTYNALETQKLRDEAATKIQPIIHSYPAGTVLVHRGDRVKADDIRVLSYLHEKQAASRHWTHQLGTLLTTLIAILFCLVMVKLRNVRLYGENPSMTLGVTFLFSALSLVMVKALTSFSYYLSLSFHSFPFNQKTLYLYLIPFALGASLIQLMSDFPLVMTFTLIFAHFAALITGHYALFFPYILAGSLAGALSLQRLQSRFDVTKAGFIVGGINILFVTIFFLTAPSFPSLKLFSITLLFALGGGILTAVFISFFSPIFEALFGLTSDLRLLELATATHPLLKQLAIAAPGTYIHSFNMALLAERAAEAIGANPLVVRVACLFHDIGKMKQPHYFIENQRGANPHNQLQPGISRMVLKNHVLQGVELAQAHHLPKVVIDAIRQHHGTKLMQFFYEAAREKSSDAVDDTAFRYPGPTPMTREMGLLLLADAVEASSRSLDEPTPGAFRNVVHTIIKSSLDDRQLDLCPLTLHDLTVIEETFVATLVSMHHNRIAYPGFDFDSNHKESQHDGDHPAETPSVPLSPPEETTPVD